MNFKQYLTENKTLLSEAIAEDVAKKLKKDLSALKTLSENLKVLATTTYDGEPGESCPIEVLKNFEKSEKMISNIIEELKDVYRKD